jgi:hypothetical protein
MCRRATIRCLLLLTITACGGAPAARAAAVSWITGADGLWQTAANWSSDPALPGAADDVTINQPTALTVTLSSGAPSIRSLAADEDLVINIGAALGVGAGGGAINGALFVNNGRLASENAGTLAINGALNPEGSTLQALTGGVLTLPALTSYSIGNAGSTLQANGAASQINLPALATFAGGTFNRTNVQAQAGGLINLSAVTSIAVGATNVESSGAGSVVNLSGLTSFSGTNFADTRRLRAENGGTITTPNLTTVGRANIEIVSAGSTIGLANITSANNASLFATGGGVVTLPALASYSVDGGGSTIQANGAGSQVNLPAVTSFAAGTFNRTNVQAQAGGLVKLSAVTAIAVGAANVESSGVGSVVDLSGLASFSGDNLADTRRLHAENGGTITSPNLTTVGRANLSIAGAGSTIGLANITSANNATFMAAAGGVLTLPALASYSVDGGGSTIQSSGAGSQVNLPAVATFAGGTFNRTNVQAQNGALINLSAVHAITVGATNVESTGAGSVVNLSGLTAFSGDNLADTRRLHAENGGTIMLGAGGPTTVTNAVVNMLGGGAINGHTLILGPSTTFNAEGAMAARLINNNGVITVAGASGSLNIVGGFTQAAEGRLRIDIGGPTPIMQFEQINLTGAATLGGNLDITLTGGFAPAYGSTFEMINAEGGVTGAFTTITWTGARPWRAEYDGGAVTLFTQFAGDFDEDGDVDGTDFGIWNSNFGMTSGATHKQGDANGDHDVDAEDFVLWQRGVGGHFPIAPAGTAVPEPGTLLLLTPWLAWRRPRGTRSVPELPTIP